MIFLFILISRRLTNYLPLEIIVTMKMIYNIYQLFMEQLSVIKLPLKTSLFDPSLLKHTSEFIEFLYFHWILQQHWNIKKEILF